jgi:RsiW-degrading membrane proteinase PrsW (M82 family)
MAGIGFNTIFFALIGGILPALLWLWFWLREDSKRPEPKLLLLLTFLIGMISVLVVLPIQKLFVGLGISEDILTIIWASIEELVKFGAVWVIALSSRSADEPIDFAMYMIIGALGFAALENALFLIDPIDLGESTVALITGNLRFLGAMLLHAVSSATIGIMLGLSFYRGWFSKKIYLLLGLGGAITLHSTFNFLIISNSGSLLNVFSLLWVVTIIVLLMFEQLRRMS